MHLVLNRAPRIPRVRAAYRQSIHLLDPESRATPVSTIPPRTIQYIAGRPYALVRQRCLELSKSIARLFTVEQQPVWVRDSGSGVDPFFLACSDRLFIGGDQPSKRAWLDVLQKVCSGSHVKAAAQ